MVEIGPLVGPVVVALLHAALDEWRQHDDDHAAVLPNHLQTHSETGGGAKPQQRPSVVRDLLRTEDPAGRDVSAQLGGTRHVYALKVNHTCAMFQNFGEKPGASQTLRSNEM